MKNKKMEEILSEKFCKTLDFMKLNSSQKYEVIFFILFESDDDPYKTLIELAKDNIPITYSDKNIAYYMKKLMVFLILRDYAIKNELFDITKYVEQLEKRVNHG